MADQVHHNGVWWHRKDDGSIHRHEPSSDDWIRWSPGDSGPHPPPQFFGAQPVAPPPSPIPAVTSAPKDWDLIGRAIAALILLLLGVWAYQACNLGELFGGDSSSGTDVPFSGSIVDFRPIDEANLEVTLELTNEGDSPAKGGCTVRAKDASGTVGFDFFSSRERIQPGESYRAAANIRIEDEGAFRVQRVTASDCEEE